MNAYNEIHIDRSETIPLCWTIADHHVKNAVRDARRLKRNCPSEFIELETIGDLPDKKESDRPERVAEYKDFLSAILGCLDPQKDRAVELMTLGSAYHEIADRLGVTTKVLNGMRNEIADTTRRLIDKSDRPTILNPQRKGIQFDQFVPTI